MIIYDRKTKRELDSIDVYLTNDEGEYLCSMLSQLLNNLKLNHLHVNDKDYSKELTIAVYGKDNLSDFDDESKRLIEKDILSK
jgi:hypothetical protein